MGRECTGKTFIKYDSQEPLATIGPFRFRMFIHQAFCSPIHTVVHELLTAPHRGSQVISVAQTKKPESLPASIVASVGTIAQAGLGPPAGDQQTSVFYSARVSGGAVHLPSNASSVGQ